MQQIEFLYLSRADVIKVGISMPEAIAVAEAVFRDQGLRRFENPPKPGVHPQPDAFIHAMPGYLPGLHAAGRTAALFSGHGYPGSGASLGDASFFGRRAGRSVARAPSC